MIYTILFLIGLVGIAAQALLGLGTHGHSGHNPAGHSHAGHAGHTQHAGIGRFSAGWLLTLLSPLTIFSVCLGIGAAGLLLRPLHLVSAPHFALALLAGLLFYAAMVRPLSNLIFQFASEPAKALDGAVAEMAEALSHFDTSGKGLVRVTVDGQLVRVLAFLEPDERAEAAAVQPGDQLMIVSVDGRANTCRVARL
jgi:hypothetical protein